MAKSQSIVALAVAVLPLSLGISIKVISPVQMDSYSVLINPFNKHTAKSPSTSLPNTNTRPLTYSLSRLSLLNRDITKRDLFIEELDKEPAAWLAVESNVISPAEYKTGKPGEERAALFTRQYKEYMTESFLREASHMNVQKKKSMCG